MSTPTLQQNRRRRKRDRCNRTCSLTWLVLVLGTTTTTLIELSSMCRAFSPIQSWNEQLLNFDHPNLIATTTLPHNNFIRVKCFLKAAATLNERVWDQVTELESEKNDDITTPSRTVKLKHRRKKAGNSRWQKKPEYVKHKQQPKLLTPQSKIELPPWLSRYYSTITTKATQHNKSSSDSKLVNKQWKHYARQKQIENEIKLFESSLLKDHGWSVRDVNDVIDTIWATASTASITASGSQAENTRTGMILGMIDFLKLIVETIAFDSEYSEELKPSKELLIASILHYVECTIARQEGAAEIVKKALFQRQVSSLTNQRQQPLLPPSAAETAGLPACTDNSEDQLQSAISKKLLPNVSTQTNLSSNNDDVSSRSDLVKIQKSSAADELNRAHLVIPLSPYDDTVDNRKRYHSSELLDRTLLETFSRHHSSEQAEIWSIVHGAARIKRAEILVQALSEEKSTPAALTAKEAARVRGLLLTIGADWRSLALRCVACLYRLDGILEMMPAVGVSQYQIRSAEIIRTTREGLRIYATLAEQLGLHRLKSHIEDRAFKILYQRQYAAVKSLYNIMDCEQRSDILQRVSEFLQLQVREVLAKDDALMSQVELLEVTGRVKEPYSFWRKLLKSKSKETDIRSHQQEKSVRSHTDDGNDSSVAEYFSTAKKRHTLSVLDVHDTVALRVILKTRELSDDEPAGIRRSREEMLCYYVQQLLVKQWPIADNLARIKDYIKHPKSNGYKSLHFTAIHKGRNGCEFPFEVQIRSEEMHEIAEFGVASHWGYKLGSSSETAPTKLLRHHSENRSASKSEQYVATKYLPSDESHNIEQTVKDAPILQTGLNNSTKNVRKSYLDALEIVRSDMVRNQVYVFLAATDEEIGVYSSRVQSWNRKAVKRKQISSFLLSLPVNSSIQDAVTAISSPNCVELGKKRELRVLRNGHVADLSDIMKNGDILMLHFC